MAQPAFAFVFVFTPAFVFAAVSRVLYTWLDSMAGRGSGVGGGKLGNAGEQWVGTCAKRSVLCFIFY